MQLDWSFALAELAVVLVVVMVFVGPDWIARRRREALLRFRNRLTCGICGCESICHDQRHGKLCGLCYRAVQPRRKPIDITITVDSADFERLAREIFGEDEGEKWKRGKK